MVSDELDREQEPPVSLGSRLLFEYFSELKSLIQELDLALEETNHGKIELTKQAFGKLEALFTSAQRLLEIIYFEIHINESETSHYQSFQTYLEHKEQLIRLNNIFLALEPQKGSPSSLHALRDCNSLNKTDSNGRREIGAKGLVGIADSGLVNQYIKQGERLLNETNQYSQQILLNLSTQREQLAGTENRISIISKTLQDSSNVLDRMTRWWHKIA